jgi:hypothetical protein
MTTRILRQPVLGIAQVGFWVEPGASSVMTAYLRGGRFNLPQSGVSTIRAAPQMQIGGHLNLAHP